MDNSLLEQREGFVYILTNKHHTVLYVGSTVDLKERCKEHRRKKNSGSFTARYNVEKLVYCKRFSSEQAARVEEKRIKGGSREKKVELIKSINGEWNDVVDQLM